MGEVPFRQTLQLFQINFRNFTLQICQTKKTIIFAPDFVPWCNGSTTVFGTVCLGSNPGGTTFKAGFLTRFLF